MEITWYIVLVFLAAFVGGIVTALMGWVSTTEPFIARKFVTSLIKALIGAAVIAVAFDYTGTQGILMLLTAFLAGAGVDAGIKRLTNTITS
jgi:TctA family transporter